MNTMRVALVTVRYYYTKEEEQILLTMVGDDEYCTERIYSRVHDSNLDFDGVPMVEIVDIKLSEHIS